MERLAELIARVAQPGLVRWIGLRPERRAPMIVVKSIELAESGLVGDRGRAGKRAVTLLQAEHLAAIGSYLGRGPVPPEDLRRNILVEGLNLLSLRNREVEIGTARLRITGPCAPCSRMQEAFGPGGYAAVRGHGGMTAQVLVSGRISLGDQVRSVELS